MRHLLLFLALLFAYLSGESVIAYPRHSSAILGPDTLQCDTARARQLLALQRKAIPQEKLHVMTDAELYQPGDTVWMRIWVQDGVTLRPSELGSNFVYIDLRDNNDENRGCLRIKQHEGKFSGYLVLPDDLLSGNYTLCAYTFYQSKMKEDFIFRKMIHILSPTHIKKGYTARSLFYGERPAAQFLESSGIAVGGYQRRDTLTRYTFPAPPMTWFAISVTDDRMSPIDTAASISAMLPKVPDYLTLEGLMRDTTLYKSSSAVENCDFVMGHLLDYKPKADSTKVPHVVIFNYKTKKIYFSKIDEKGQYLVLNADTPDGSMYCIAAYNHHDIRDFQIEPYYLDLPDNFHHLWPKRGERYFVNMNSPSESPDFEYDLSLIEAVVERDHGDYMRKLEEVNVTAKNRGGRLLKKLSKVVNDSTERDDEFTLNATRSILWYDFPIGMDRLTTEHLVSRFRDEGIRISHGAAYYLGEDGQYAPVRIFIEDTECPITLLDKGRIAPQDELQIPTELLVAVDYLDPEAARRVRPNGKWPNSPIIRFDLSNLEHNYSKVFENNMYFFYPVGYQQPKTFYTNRFNANALHTYYWNPALNSGRDGQLTIEVPIPRGRNLSYTIRAEGVTPEGQPVTILRRIRL